MKNEYKIINKKIKVKSKENNFYVIEIYGKKVLDIHLNKIDKENKTLKRYNKKLIHIDELKKSSKFEKDKKFQEFEDFSFLKKYINNNKNIITIEEDLNDLNLIIDLPKSHISHTSPINIFYELLNVEYYLTKGPNHERINEKPFYASLYGETFILNDIKLILEKENIINKYEIDSYRFYDENLKGFVKLNEVKEYKMPQNNLILELHFNKYIDPITLELENLDNDISNKIKHMKNEIKYSQNTKEYDLIYLYASPIIDENEKEFYDRIDYRNEIKDIVNIFKKSGKSYNCLFECANEKIFCECLIQKKTKILHISSHGSFDKSKDKDKDYLLLLEDKGKKQIIKYDKLENLLKTNSSKIKNILKGIIQFQI